MQSCPKRWRSRPQSGPPFEKNLAHARHLAGVRSPSSTLLAFWGRPDGEVKFDGKTRHFRHSRRRILDSVDNSDGKRHESSMTLTKNRRAAWYFLTTHRPREGIRTYILVLIISLACLLTLKYHGGRWCFVGTLVPFATFPSEFATLTQK